jgi:hypothetical protein
MGIMRYKPKEKNINKLKQFLSRCQYQTQSQERSKGILSKDVLFKLAENMENKRR